MSRRLDAIGAFLANLHALLGHDKAAAFLGVPVGDKDACVLCRYDKALASKNEVVDRIGVDP